MTKKIALAPEIIDCVDTLQTGGAEMWDTTIRKALYCVVNGECYGNAEERLKLAQELLCMQDMLSTFIPEGGTQ